MFKVGDRVRMISTESTQDRYGHVPGTMLDVGDVSEIIDARDQMLSLTDDIGSYAAEDFELVSETAEHSEDENFTASLSGTYVVENGDVRFSSAFDKQTGGNHYKDLKIQPMEYALANKLDLAQGNVVKYVTRFRAKNGIEDLRKAIHCIELLIEFEERK